MSAAESSIGTPEGRPTVQVAPDGGDPCYWRPYVAGSLLLAAAVVWATVAYQEQRFARATLGPESRLLSTEELEDQLQI